MDWLKIAAGSGLAGVALGAFGAHALKTRLSAEMLHAWNTGVLYQLVHAVALLALSMFGKAAATDIRWGGRFFLAGTTLFSGSLYAMSLSGFKAFGAVTPLGGLCFLMGWGWMALSLSSRP